MRKITRADLIGHKLDLECHRAKTTTNEYGPNDKRVYCYGLYDDHTENLCSKCSECKAYVYNSAPLRKELMSKELTPLEAMQILRQDIGKCYEDEANIVENALREKQEQDCVVKTIKETIKFSKTMPQIKPNDKGDLGISEYAGLMVQRQLTNKKRELLRNWILKECFPKEFEALQENTKYKKAVEIIKKKDVIIN